MKKAVLIIMLALTLASCSKVPAGFVGVKVFLLGGAKGIDSEELSPGRYWIGFNEDLFLFPTFTQNYVWTKDLQEGSPNNEEILFQTKEGMEVSGDFGISYHVDPSKVSVIFQKYRKGIEEITDIYLRNMTRDALNHYASNMSVESVYGAGKTAMIKSVEETVREQVAEIGIIVERIYLIGSLRLPNEVIAALNRKIQATQKAEQVENELREAEATAKKQVALAQGEANAILAKAEAQAKANNLLSASITPELNQNQLIIKWNGQLPGVTGGVIPMLNIK